MTDGYAIAASARPDPDYVDQQLRIGVEKDAVLAARLYLPLGAGAPPFPTVLAISAGPAERYQYEMLREEFLRHGIAVMEYDKRGAFLSTGEQAHEVTAQVRDADAILSALCDRIDIDHSRVALLGLCQGGVVAATLAAWRERVAGLVLLAVPVGNGAILFAEQLELALEDWAMSVDDARHVLEAVANLLQAHDALAPQEAVAARRGAAVDGLIAAGHPRATAEEVVDWLHNAEMLASRQTGLEVTLTQVRMPVLALYGSIDLEVPAAINVPAAREALAGNPDATVIELPSNNHWFQHAKTGSWAEMVELGVLNCAPEMIEIVAGWLVRKLCSDVRR